MDRTRDGRPLAPLLHGAHPRSWRRALLVEHFDDRVVSGDPDLQGWSEGRPSTYAALRARWWTYVQYADGEREFYDRRRDPGELHNVADRLSPARLARLSAALARYRECRGEQQCRAAGRGA
jgi:arylsulfatase A-like enzyme